MKGFQVVTKGEKKRIVDEFNDFVFMKLLQGHSIETNHFRKISIISRPATKEATEKNGFKIDEHVIDIETKSIDDGFHTFKTGIHAKSLIEKYKQKFKQVYLYVNQ